MSESLLHPWKQSEPIVMTLSGMTIDSKAVHPSKSLTLSWVNVFGNVTEVSAVQLWKQNELMLLTLSVRMIDTNPEFAKA